jgi:pyridoxal 5'-phosphate synthase pdxT subunit
MIGVLALQGAFREHRSVLERLGADAIEVRTPRDLERATALIIPGGESTTIDKLLDSSGLRGPLTHRLDEGMSVFGTCAGLIVLATAAVDATPDQRLLGAIPITTRRNGYGRQRRSFEALVTLTDDPEPLRGVFIRAPRITSLGPGVEVVATLDAEPVAVAYRRVLVAAFHPELTDDDRLHRRFLDLVAAPVA